MMGKKKGGILFVLLCAKPTDAFVSPTPSRTAAHSSPVRLTPDRQGVTGGDGDFVRYRWYDPGYIDSSNVGTNVDPQGMGGALARGGLSQDGAPPGQPMVRTDASAPRTQASGGRSTVQGSGSRATWASPDPFGYDEMNVHLGTAGRPLAVDVEHWSGPDNTPTRMQLYSEDGGARPWMTTFKTPKGAPSGIAQVRNVGPMEFPIEASVTGSNSLDAAAGGPAEGGGAPMPGGQMTRPVTIQGGSLKTFGFDHSIQHVYVEISSDGLPVNARVDVLQGPNNSRAVAEIYTDHGLNRPWFALIPLPGYGSSLEVRNEGPMEYPIKVSVDPPPTTAFW